MCVRLPQPQVDDRRKPTPGEARGFSEVTLRPASTVTLCADPEVQEALLSLDDQETIRFFSERRLRPLARLRHVDQSQAFRRMLQESRGGTPLGR